MLLMDVRGPVAQTNVEIRAADSAYQWRKVERERLHRRRALIEVVINDMELLNLAGAMRVPLAYEARLLALRAELADAISQEQLDSIRTRVRPVKLMDCLYTIQEALLAQRRPDLQRQLDEADDTAA
jgi:hypothetical protein